MSGVFPIGGGWGYCLRSSLLVSLGLSSCIICSNSSSHIITSSWGSALFSLWVHGCVVDHVDFEG